MAVAVAAQSSSSSSATPTTTRFDDGVPTDQPLPGDYNGALRPQVHYSPPSGFMNDPNGCFVDADGIWHFYYQCKVLFHTFQSFPYLDFMEFERGSVII